MPLVDPIPPPTPSAETPTDTLRELYVRFHVVVFRAAYGITGSRDDAEDVLQDVFVGLPEALKGFEGRGSLEGWIRRIAVRTALTPLRGRRRRAEVPLDLVSAGEYATPPNGAVDQVTLGAMVARLPQNLRSVFVLKDVEGYSHAEIGKLLGIRPATSEVRLHRARKRLRALLRDA